MLKYHVAVCDDEKSDLDGIVQSVQQYDVQGCFDIETYISCIATAYHEFIRLGPELYIESLDVLLNAWNGETDSMSSANLLGICRFVELYQSEYNKGRLIAKLRQVDAFTIFRLARTAGVSLPGKTKYLQQVYTIYNGGSRRAALPPKF